MSVNIKFKQVSNDTKWTTIQNGDFAIIEGDEKITIPNGLYRIFIVPSQTNNEPRIICLIPIFEGPFAEGLFPFFLPFQSPLPRLVQQVNKINIDAEVSI